MTFEINPETRRDILYVPPDYLAEERNLCELTQRVFNLMFNALVLNDQSITTADIKRLTDKLFAHHDPDLPVNLRGDVWEVSFQLVEHFWALSKEHMCLPEAELKTIVFVKESKT